jgi:hypothetical protein
VEPDVLLEDFNEERDSGNGDAKLVAPRIK